MWSLRTWAAASHQRAVANARAGSTECSQRRVEREEVALFLASLTSDDQHIAGAEVEHPA